MIMHFFYATECLLLAYFIDFMNFIDVKGW